MDTEELRVLEHLSRPQQKDGHGIYGQGWESPINAFKAAKSFHNQLKKQAKDSIKNGSMFYLYICQSPQALCLIL